MNREIKFRAWDYRRMNYQPIVSDGTDGGETSRVMLNESIECFDYILMQYIGLKDKNGVEIYEGDIIRVKWQKDSIGGYLQSSDSYIEKEEIVVVEWMNIGWGFKKSDGKYLSLPKNCNIEKIGNVFENPEHLK